jgi:hypothetical protein
MARKSTEVIATRVFIFNVQLSIVNCQFFKQGQIYDDIKIDAKIKDESAKTYAA